jgi:hypothetical protein
MAEGMVVTVIRQPVLARVRVGARSTYERTKEPLETREERLIRLETRRRALISWDIANAASFSLGTGRCIGNPNWLLTEESRKALRKLARVQFPREARPTEAEAETTDAAESDERSPMEIAASNSQEPT